MKNKSLNFEFSGLMFSINMIFAALGSYGTLYLLSKGFNESKIGIIMATSSILSTIIQPLIAKKADQSIKWSLHEFNILSILPILLSLICLLIFSTHSFLIVFCFTISYSLVNTMMPLINSISMVLNLSNYPVEYGIGRAIGSFSFAISTTLIGLIIHQWGINSIIIFSIIAIIIYLVFLHQIPLQHIKQSTYKNINYSKQTIEPILNNNGSSENFFIKYIKFTYVLIGIIFFFIFHILVNTYMFQIVSNVGGNEQQMGYAMTLAALVEVPIMLSYSKFKYKLSIRNAMLLSGIFFLLKVILTFIANNMTMIYIAQTLQMLSFGLYSTVCIHFANESVEKNDLVMGQAMITTAQTLGAIIGSVVGGLIINYFNISYALIFCIIACIIGNLFFWKGLK